MLFRKRVYAVFLFLSFGLLFVLHGGLSKVNKNRLEALERKLTEIARYCRVPDSVYCETPTGYGKISKKTGRSRTNIVGGHYRGSTWVNSYARS